MEYKKQFTHLHVHTEYSLLDGSAKISELVSSAKNMGMDALAITDHGVMYGCINFYKACLDKGIKPIIGSEVYIANTSRFDKQMSEDNFYYHLVLLAKDNTGYSNLTKLVSLGFTEGFYKKPRIDFDILNEYKEGLIALSACIAGPIARTFLQKGYDHAKQVAKRYQDTFGEDFYLELQDHGIREQRDVNNALLRLNKELGIPLVATNDLHYIKREDAKAHDLLLCVQTGTNVDTPNRMQYEGDNFYLKSQDEMYELFKYIPEACENTNDIAKKCNVEFEFNKYKLPKFDVPNGYTPLEYLTKLCYEGLEVRYGLVEALHKERLEYELGVINSMGFVDYFLIVWDLIKYAKDNDIPVGPGRGSAAGSIASYALKITDIDPIRFGLIFERFLNPERVTMPDVDIDFCYERRQEVIDYVNKKYGNDHVVQIITFGTMAAKNAVRDVARVLNMPYSEGDRIAKQIPNELGITIKKALDRNPELKNMYETEEQVKLILDMSIKLEGLPRHSSTHAAGVIISDKPVAEYVPLNLNIKDNSLTTQYPMTTCEELGLLKMDFLGLRTLTVIKNTFDLVNNKHGINLNGDSLDYNDSDTFKLLSSGHTLGVFQLESAGMISFMKELKPSCIEDIIAGISLYRPGPMDFIPQYILGKNNPDKVEYKHPLLRPILEETYGCIVYQEQVMEIVRTLAGYSLGRSDMVRRAMSKKKADVMAKEREFFINGDGDIPGCVKNGISEEIANQIFDEMISFAQYAFNKSHAAAYAVVAYQTAWLKVHYPLEFMASTMTSVQNNTARLISYITNCKQMGIAIKSPNVNEGFSGFSVSSDGAILYGLAAVKGVGTTIINELVKDRNKNGVFRSLIDFVDRLRDKLNPKAIESLILVGAFDSLGGSRAQYMNLFPVINQRFKNNRKYSIEGQIDLFSISQSEDERYIKDDLPDVGEFDNKQKLAYEKDILGLYLSGNPLDEHWDMIKRYISNITTDFPVSYDEVLDKNKVQDEQQVIVAGFISGITIKYTKNNKAMAFIKLEDLYGTIEILVFPNVYTKFINDINEDEIILVKGRASISEDQEPKIICEKVTTVEKLEQSTKTLWIKLPKESDKTIEDISHLLSYYSGESKVIIYDEKTNQKLIASKDKYVRINSVLLVELEEMLGEGNVINK